MCDGLLGPSGRSGQALEKEVEHLKVQAAAKSDSGRFQIANPMPTILRNSMLLDTVTGKTWLFWYTPTVMERRWTEPRARVGAKCLRRLGAIQRNRVRGRSADHGSPGKPGERPRPGRRRLLGHGARGNGPPKDGDDPSLEVLGQRSFLEGPRWSKFRCWTSKWTRVLSSPSVQLLPQSVNTGHPEAERESGLVVTPPPGSREVGHDEPALSDLGNDPVQYASYEVVTVDPKRLVPGATDACLDRRGTAFMSLNAIATNPMEPVALAGPRSAPSPCRRSVAVLWVWRDQSELEERSLKDEGPFVPVAVNWTAVGDGVVDCGVATDAGDIRRLSFGFFLDSNAKASPSTSARRSTSVGSRIRSSRTATYELASIRLDPLPVPEQCGSMR